MVDTEATEDERRLARKRRQRRAKRIRWAIYLFVTAAIVALMTVALWPKPTQVVLSTAQRGALRVTVNEDGQTHAKNRYVISAPLGGTMSRIVLEPGDRVAEGEAILRIVPGPPPLLDKRTRANAETRLAAARAALKLSLAEVDRATAAHSQALLQSDRIRKLVKAGVASTDDLEQAEFSERTRQAELRAAQFGAKVRRQDEASARAALGHLDQRGVSDEGIDITAPASGVVLRILREDQQGLVGAGAPLLEIADLSQLEVEVDLLTADAVNIRAGAQAKIIRWGGTEELSGHVKRVDPAAFTRISALGVEEQRVLVIIDLDSPQDAWKSLGDGYRVEVEITTWEGKDVLTIPADAVFRHENRWAVFTAEDGLARRTFIDIGHRNDRQVEVLTGLESGAQVISHPSDQVKDGGKIAE